MNYMQKTPFMDLYEELSNINEAEAAELDDYQNNFGQSIITLNDLNSLMQECSNSLKGAINANFNSAEILNKSKSMILFTTNKNGPTYYTCEGNWYNGKKQDQVDLASSWLGFVFILKGKRALINELINNLRTVHSETLDWSRVIIGKLGGAKLRVHSSWYNCYGIFVRCGEYAKDSTVTSFINVIDDLELEPESILGASAEKTQNTEVDAIDKIVQFESRLDQAKKFIIDFINFLGKNKNHCLYPSEITDEIIANLSEAELKDFDFYIDDLIDYYQKADRINKRRMEKLLQIFKVKLCGTGENDDYQSIQYLANSGKQERILAGYSKYLVRNDEATHTDNISDPEEKYHYLVAKHGGKVTNIPDFTSTLDASIKIDAKIYGSVSSMKTNYRKKTHNADFLIVYLKYSVTDSINHLNTKLKGCTDPHEYAKLRTQLYSINTAANQFSTQLSDHNGHWLVIDLNKGKTGSEKVYEQLKELANKLNNDYPQITLLNTIA